MGKNLSNRLRALRGLDQPGGGRLPPAPRDRHGGGFPGREQRARLRELSEKMKHKDDTKRANAQTIAATTGKAALAARDKKRSAQACSLRAMN